MKELMRCAALLAAGMMTTLTPASADSSDSGRPITVAVFGDWPYNQNLLDNKSLLIDSVNADPAVSLVIHVGDIHSGSMPCTSAGILPPITTSNPGWNQGIYAAFQQFKAPMIYTPGDNEWTDCHKSKEASAGDPLKELTSLRSLFFARPGHSLGLADKGVISQALSYNTAYPTDAKFVENVIWEDSHVVFVTLNVPGSNNDTLPWTGTFSNPGAQGQELVERNGANQRWLQAAFSRAEANHARGVVIALQADMWDPAALAVGGDGLSAYTPFVRQLADLSIRFQRPVLLLNGDSHLYGADRPLANPASATGTIHGTPAVPNLTRITVQGSTNTPAEWLRLTIDQSNPNLFSWTNVPYCKNPLGSCQ
ncbi:hypothetical protein [Cupriavidus lacunae]|uniref:Calcineurin-like phosphoesterase domain-containing protein n=1 Tax=Cupriavidus lacunae TaxID=2666307 RepID=A0A370NHG5_9BURK|nr:hypothetical protein [Cupriavidus lacunae]RDK05015.1 hypothetical protein DN412_39345 [Cupriavidus lacunae]